MLVLDLKKKICSSQLVDQLPSDSPGHCLFHSIDAGHMFDGMPPSEGGRGAPLAAACGSLLNFLLRYILHKWAISAL